MRQIPVVDEILVSFLENVFLNFHLHFNDLCFQILVHFLLILTNQLFNVVLLEYALKLFLPRDGEMLAVGIEIGLEQGTSKQTDSVNFLAELLKDIGNHQEDQVVRNQFGFGFEVQCHDIDHDLH